MTTMTFESISISPRRAAVRRSSRPAVRVVAPAKQQAAIASIRTSSDVIGSRNKSGLIALIGLTVVLHAAIITAVNRRAPIEPVALPKAPPLTIDMAPPPPPPPPVIQPKPLPQIAKPVAAPVKPAPSVPIVRSATPVDTTAPTADTVQVATAPAPAPVAAPVERVTEPRGYAGYLRNPAPAYPQSAQDKGLEGQVLLKVHVLASGQPDDVSVAKSSGHKILDEAAIKAVTAWAFEPARRGETPIDGWVKVPLNFKLS